MARSVVRLPARSQRAHECDPQHQHAQEGIGPDQARIEKVAQDDLQRRENHDRTEQEREQDILDVMNHSEHARSLVALRVYTHCASATEATPAR